MKELLMMIESIYCDALIDGSIKMDYRAYPAKTKCIESAMGKFNNGVMFDTIRKEILPELKQFANEQ